MGLATGLLDIISRPWLGKTAVFLLLTWTILNGVAYIFGSVGLYSIGKRKQTGPAAFAFLPGFQIYYVVKLVYTRKTAEKAEFLLWWDASLRVAFLTFVVWTAVIVSQGHTGRLMIFFLIADIILLAASLYFYVRIRILEFSALRHLFAGNGLMLGLSIAGTVIGIFLQGLFLFGMRYESAKK